VHSPTYEPLSASYVDPPVNALPLELNCHEPASVNPAGLVAVNGSYYVQVERIDSLAFGLSVAVGMLSTAILVVNNVRDIETDRRAGKQTLAVRLGRTQTRKLYAGLVDGAYVVLLATLVIKGGPWWALLGLLSIPLLGRPMRAVQTRTDGATLNAALAGTGVLLAAFSLLVSLGLLIAS